MKPWDGIISEEDQKRLPAAGFGRPGGVGKRPALLDHRRAVPDRRHDADAVLGGHQGVPDVLRRGRLERDAQHRDAARGVPPQRLAGALPARRAEEQGHRRRPPRRRRCPPSWTSPEQGYEFVAEIAPQRRRRAAAEEAPERVLRHAAREPPDRPAAPTRWSSPAARPAAACAAASSTRFAYNFRVLVAVGLRLRPQRDLARGESLRHGGEVRRRRDCRRDPREAAPAREGADGAQGRLRSARR